MMKQMNKATIIIRVILSAFAIIITGMASTLVENNFVESLRNNLIAQMSIMAVLLTILAYNIVQFRKERDSKTLSDLISVGLCISFVLYFNVSTVNTSIEKSRESSIAQRLITVETVEYSEPSFAWPKHEYYQAFLLDGNHVLLATDVLYSDRQVFYGNKKLWPDTYIDNEYCIAYFDDPVQLSEVDVTAIPENLDINGMVKCYLHPEEYVSMEKNGFISGRITSINGLLPTNIENRDIALSPNLNIVPVSRQGKFLGFLQFDSGEYAKVRLHSSLFDDTTITKFLQASIDEHIHNMDDREGALNTEGFSTITTFVMSNLPLSRVHMSNGFTRSEIRKDYTRKVNDSYQKYYIYTNIIYLDKNSSIPLQGVAFEYWSEFAGKEYSDARKVNDDGLNLVDYTYWTVSYGYYPVLLKDIATDIFRRSYIDSRKHPVICDQGKCEANYYCYQESSRSGIYR